MSGLNLLVFRGDQRCASGKELKAALTAQLEQVRSSFSQRDLLGALLRAGELECGVADASPEAASSCERLTDHVANALWIGEHAASVDSNPQKFIVQSLIKAARALPAFEQLSISIPEGFAYYALHPLAYADAIQRIPMSGCLLVVGIRSIGTTLSAVAATAARARGIVAERVTVRPQGHPYNRAAEFTAEQMTVV
ncbi:MAG TPA: hypothetical protein VE176_10775, partial [Candidatus Limnocylindrales bacterium]|nr:hypothetical protein [Candidatus Limnocylindrales bacterium]